ncbi:hypothetical protein R83H12_00434 [Fibrobacteria bacterium R8-3-H12]
MAKVAKKSVLDTPQTEWQKKSISERLAFFQNFAKNRPKNVPLTDDDIQEEVNMVRYGNKQGKPNRNWAEDLDMVEEIKSRICLK